MDLVRKQRLSFKELEGALALNWTKSINSYLSTYDLLCTICILYKLIMPNHTAERGARMKRRIGGGGAFGCGILNSLYFFPT